MVRQQIDSMLYGQTLHIHWPRTAMCKFALNAERCEAATTRAGSPLQLVWWQVSIQLIALLIQLERLTGCEQAFSQIRLLTVLLLPPHNGLCIVARTDLGAVLICSACRLLDRLDAPFGTEDKPVQVTSSFTERVVGVPDPYDDSIIWWGKIEADQPPKQIIEGGEYFVLRVLEESGDPHH